MFTNMLRLKSHLNEADNGNDNGGNEEGTVINVHQCSDGKLLQIPHRKIKTIDD